MRIELGGDDRLISALYRAIAIEALSPPNPNRVEARTLYETGRCIIEIRSTDIPSLRAAFNSYMYLLYTILRSLEAGH